MAELSDGGHIGKNEVMNSLVHNLVNVKKTDYYSSD